MSVSEESAGARGFEPDDGLLAACLERVEAHVERAVESLCREHPDEAAAIRVRMEAVRSGALTTTRISAATADGDSGFEPIGPYRPLQELGRGGQAVVYLAEDARLHRVVALKLLRGFGPLSEKMIERFRREAEVASKLDHPGICTVYDAGVREGIPYIAMRYVEGKSLSARIREARAGAMEPATLTSFVDLSPEETLEEPEPRGPSPSRSVTGTTKQEVLRVVDLIEKAARALHAAHEAGILHRDVKPGNIMVTPGGDPVLLDFGLASEEAEQLALTQTGDLFGTPAYMSPEQLMAKRIRLDRRTDVYSLGVTLYECLTLRRPFEGATREGLYQAIQYKEAPDPRKLNPLIPPDLRVVVEKALEKDRDRRYASAEALAEDLRRVGKNEPVSARPVGRPGRILRWVRRRPARAGLAAALVIGIPLVSALGTYAWGKQPDIARARAEARRLEVETRVDRGFLELAELAPEAALSWFTRALGEDARNFEALAGSAFALSRRGENRRLLALLDGHPELERAAPSLAHLRASALRSLGRAGEARDIERHEIRPATTPLGHFVEGLWHLRDCPCEADQASIRLALHAFLRATLATPHARIIYHVQVAHAASHLRNENASTLAAVTLVGLWPRSARAHLWAGRALRNRGDLVGAERALRTASELQPTLLPALVELGRLRYQRGDHSGAEKVLARAAALECEPAVRLHAGLGDLDRSSVLKPLAEAAPRLDGVLAGTDEPSSPSEAANLARVAFHRGRFDVSVRLFRYVADLEGDLLNRGDNRLVAAFAAVQAAARAGEAEAEEVSTWLQLAVAWLAADLEIRIARYEKDRTLEQELRRVLGELQASRMLAPLREAGLTERLDEDGRAALEAFWIQVGRRVDQLAERH